MKKPRIMPLLLINASRFLNVPKIWIIYIVPNCGKTAYFVHWNEFLLNGRTIPRTTLVSKETLEA
jgi:hypothetical protein